MNINLALQWYNQQTNKATVALRTIFIQYLFIDGANGRAIWQKRNTNVRVGVESIRVSE